MRKPIRIQRKRTRGWKIPENAVYVGRGTKWGNPCKIGDRIDSPDRQTHYYADRDEVIRLFKVRLNIILENYPHWLDELRGKDLVCWCPVGKPCHADILLELANREVA